MQRTHFAVLTFFFCLVANLAHAQDAVSATERSLTTDVTVVDHDKDCDVHFKAGTISVTVPSTNHNLHPERGLNAPRVLTKLSGNFTVQVKVTGEFKPGKKSTKELGQGRPFNGAGILIWENENNFLRVERNAYWVNDTLFCYPPLIEYWRDKKDQGVNSRPTAADNYFKTQSTWFKIVRTGNEMVVSVSHNGTDWSDVKTFSASFSPELLVGVAAVNSSDTPFTATFENFSITVDDDDRTKR